jgi:transcriptional regulator with XRE-family HTH domain
MNTLDDVLVLRDKIGDRIREARVRLGLKQSELAKIGGVARATQVAYEAGYTEPTTSYFRKIQLTSIDIPFVLFGMDAGQIHRNVLEVGGIDWSLLQSCHEHVEFFCLRFAPNCPQGYRWKMVAQVYQAFCTNKHNSSTEKNSSNTDNPLTLIQALWNSYEPASI